jgi:hypothetical protein
LPRHFAIELFDAFSADFRQPLTVFAAIFIYATPPPQRFASRRQPRITPPRTPLSFTPPLRRLHSHAAAFRAFAAYVSAADFRCHCRRLRRRRQRQLAPPVRLKIFRLSAAVFATLSR